MQNQSRFRRCRFASLLASLTCALLTARADSASFRGPWGGGHASPPGDARLRGFRLTWSETNNIKWKTEIPYKGWSTPVVLGNQIWITTATPEGRDYFAICVDK